MANEQVRKVVDIVDDIKIGMFTTHGAGGLLSRPLTVVEVKENGDLWFFSAADTDLVREIEANSEVNVCFAGSKKWVSVSGRAQVVREVAKKKQLWNSMVEIFASDGPESPNTVLVHVASDSAEYWENPGGAASIVTNWIKEKISGDGEHPGTSNTVQL
ncbi:pyridoxamine 5'-phosphate oxidase family protein [Glutamicibacter sp. MNS18]|uniref:pyridoxamine 5'-phosphate oxidase family protein n=1 Tax=Glutamicibacter sp. MNS18 TaxID=2989817 RepID=UPI0022357E09|nr:pyridoxamine 5'-phosphate oxidase family protein [Glutamicibacter sp. MNS18]MCW4467314.1 pyridoxamine 5'-phosphate oxidase family protein [Glutamicibacter sp. MNS18]